MPMVDIISFENLSRILDRHENLVRLVCQYSLLFLIATSLLVSSLPHCSIVIFFFVYLSLVIA